MARPKQYTDAVSQHLKIERADFEKSAEYAQADGVSWNAWILQLVRKELRKRAKDE